MSASDVRPPSGKQDYSTKLTVPEQYSVSASSDVSMNPQNRISFLSQDALSALNKEFISVFFIELTQILYQSTTAAIESSEFRSGRRDICLLPKGVQGVTRAFLPRTFLARDIGVNTVIYNSGDVCLVGGSALHAYGLALKPILGKNIAEALPTVDIDAVWWPSTTTIHSSRQRILSKVRDNSYLPLVNDRQSYRELPIEVYEQANEFVPVSLSPLIENLALCVSREMGRYAQLFLEKYIHNVQVLLQRFIHDDINPTVETRVNHIRMPGVWNVTCTLRLNSEQSIQLLDLSIHDGASSQKAMTLEDRRTDFVYQAMTQITFNDWRVVQLPVGGIYITVPTLKRFAIQQWMVLSNRINIFWRTQDQTLSRRVQVHHIRIREVIGLIQLLQMYSNTTDIIMYFENTVNRQYSELFAFLYQIVFPRWFHQAEWLASCPFDTDRCITSESDKKLLTLLCSENKVLRPDMLCVSRGGKHTTRRLNRSDRGRTKRQKKHQKK